MSLYEETSRRLSELIRHRRYFHTHAEAGYDLKMTLGYIKAHFTQWGIDYVEPLPGALTADIGPGTPKLLLRADTDALPMQEENDLSYKSMTAYAHTCGHDLHSAMMLEAAHLLKHRESELPCAVRILFQPDEEGVTGARSVIRAGVLEPALEAAYALHVSPTMKAGTLFYTHGAMYASSDTLHIHIEGLSGHGAAPHHARDPIFAAVQIYNALQGLITRRCPPDEMAVLSICTFQGGEAFNVIPESVDMTGTLRTYNEALRTQLKEHLISMVPQIAAGCNTKAQISFPTGTPAVMCDSELQIQLLKGFGAELPADKVRLQPKPFSWSEDFGLFGAFVPISMMTLGAQAEDKPSSIHNSTVLFDETAMITGTTALASAALHYKPK